jgi:glycogen operon protein
MEIWPGDVFPLGATFDGTGVNFAVFSEVAEHIELCLFDDDGEETRLRLPESKNFVHAGYVDGLGPGQRYGFRVHGPWNPGNGSRCNPAKLLLDPYAKAITGTVDWGPEVYGHEAADTTVRNDADSAGSVPLAVVVSPWFDWGEERPQRVPLHETVIYEAHVRGLTMTHPDVPENLRGTYAGLTTPAVLDHLRSIGVTAVELLPVHQFIDDHFLLDLGLSNYWGYNSIGFFAPHGRYSASGDAGGQVTEFKSMVKTLHSEGFEVILDVVYNHTAEGNHLGPQLCFKGFDNAAYYRLDPNDRQHYIDYTGTGNSLNMRHPHSLQLVMDSLRYWIEEMHVDGFRFDLASTLARELHEVDRLSAFFDLIHQDPVVSRVKLIAEPWDVGEGGYQVGNFPVLWSEWNGRYRDGVRNFWRSADESLADFASRFTGSSDLYAWSGRRPSASVNFITAHDGFTLADLVAHDRKHNAANGENSRDGDSHNHSWNSGAEGPTDDPAIIEIRRVRQRSMLATLFLSQGVPMLLGGDEIGRTQHGNNNAYCQDNEISWLDWSRVDTDLLEFVRHVATLRTEHPVFRRRRWFEGRPIHGEVDDIHWYTPEGVEMSDDDWNVGYARSLAVFLNGEGIESRTRRDEPIVDDSFLVLFNAAPDPITFVIADGLGGSYWEVDLDTAAATNNGALISSSEKWDLDPWAVLVLRRVTAPPGGIEA